MTRDNLLATVEELETSNEELQTTNEELLARNEELHKVNAEYQIKLLELTERSNDLENLIAATRIGTLFLDENLEIRKYTPEIRRIFRISPGDLGRPLAQLTHNLANVDLMAILHRVEGEKSPCDMEVCTLDGSRFLMRVLPYQIGGGNTSGIVLTFTDIGSIERNGANVLHHQAAG
ncbi:MAG: PAS domain-containing protein [Syntrophobacteraceae bacterium]